MAVLLEHSISPVLIHHFIFVDIVFGTYRQSFFLFFVFILECLFSLNFHLNGILIVVETD
jgi:hypothetical protein